MAATSIRGSQVVNGSIQRVDLDTTTVGQAVVAKIIQGSNISLSSTGGDSGTGDVTISATGTIGPPGVSSFTTCQAFTVPAVGATVTVTVANASWMVVGEMVYVDQAGGGPGAAGALQITAISGNQVTLLNPTPPGSIPLADSTQSGLLRQVSGLTTDFVDGSNNCRNLLASVPLATSSANGLLKQISGASTDYVGGDNNCHALIAALTGLLVPPGTVLDYGGFNAPSGFLLVDGSAQSRTTYPALFNALTIQTTGNTTSGSAIITAMGTTANMQVGDPISGPGIPAAATVSTVDSASQIHISANATATATGVAIVDAPWGVGDGSTTFNLPDPRGRAVIAKGQGTGLTNRLLADTGGEENHALAVGELAVHGHSIAAGQFSHSHTINQPTHAHVGGQAINWSGSTWATGSIQTLFTLNNGSAQYWSGNTDARTTGDTAAANTLPAGSAANTGSGTAHNNMMPYIAFTKIIKT